MTRLLAILTYTLETEYNGKYSALTYYDDLREAIEDADAATFPARVVNYKGAVQYLNKYAKQL